MPDFLWGVATSAYQVEGGIARADWTDFEARIGKEFEGAGEACGHFAHAREDVRKIRAAGFTAYRFSVEWSRVEPEPGVFDREAIAHYRDVVEACREAGLAVVLTIHHFTLPRWLARQGGVLAKDFPELFAAYTRRLADALDVTWWLTINEPMVLAVMGYVDGSWPPGEKSIVRGLKAGRALARAHRLAYAVLKEKPGRRVGIAKHLTVFYPYNPKRLADRLGVFVQHKIFNEWFLTLTRGKLDFLGVNFYARSYSKGPFGIVRARPGEKTTDMGWVSDAEDFRTALREAASHELPVMVTENGIATTFDDERAAYIRDHVGVVLAEREAGLFLTGYFYWSIWDNFEWREGWRPGFGLAPRPTDGSRLSLRPAGILYAEIARTDGAALSAAGPVATEVT